jgi:hypothetical protein
VHWGSDRMEWSPCPAWLHFGSDGLGREHFGS